MAAPAGSMIERAGPGEGLVQCCCCEEPVSSRARVYPNDLAASVATLDEQEVLSNSLKRGKARVRATRQRPDDRLCPSCFKFLVRQVGKYRVSRAWQSDCRGTLVCARAVPCQTALQESAHTPHGRFLSRCAA